MKVADQCPSEASWQCWITGDGQLLTQQDRFLEHLDHCQTCQQMVQSLSKRDPFFSESRRVLRQTGLSGSDESFETTADASDGSPSPAVVAVVQSLLGPSDDDQSLGRIGRFEVTGVIGSGGMGIVLKARSIDVDRVVAVKIPQPQYWQAADTLMTLEREARSAAAVVHPNVIAIYHVDRYRDVPYLVMPYLPGESLEQRIRSQGPLGVEAALKILRQVASALSAAHQCGVVHRDVKPANILLVGRTERAVLSDFGLAKVQAEATCTATGIFAGTPIYLSPEQASGKATGPASDLYSLGTVLWTMIAGAPPMQGMHTHAIVRQIADGQMPRPDQQTSDAPDWILRLIERLHTADPNDRPTAEQVTGWIEQCERHLSGPNREILPDELRTKEGRWMQKARRPLIAVTLVIVAVTALLSIPSDTRNLVPPQQPASETDQPSQDPQTNVLVEPGDQVQQQLDEMQAELDAIHRNQLPRWESEIKSLLEKQP